MADKVRYEAREPVSSWGRAVDLRKWVVIAIPLSLVLLASYLWAQHQTPEGKVYLWNSYNPLDTDTYFAKMRLGWSGVWRSHLLATPERGQEGAYINLFYIALGHVARWLRIPIPAVFHTMRVIAGQMLCVTVSWLAGLMMETEDDRRWGLWLALAGGGLGWAFFFLPTSPVDLWVPEAYGFLGMLVNPHFPLAQALMCLVMGMFLWWMERPQKAGPLLMAMAGALVALSILQVFGVVTVLITWALVVLAGLAWGQRWRLLDLFGLGIVGMLGIAYPLYVLIAVRSDPDLAGWSAQNVCLSPPWWAWTLGFGLVLPGAVAGGMRVWRTRNRRGTVLLAWVLATVLEVTVPSHIQRRFSLGLSLPLGLLAAWEYGCWAKRLPWRA